MKLKIMWILLAGFGLTYMELVLNYITSSKDKMFLNGTKFTLFSKVPLWSLLTYTSAASVTLLVYWGVSFMYGTTGFGLLFIVFIHVSWIACIIKEILLGIFYTAIGVRHWDYRQTAKHPINIRIALFFKGHTDLLHIGIYFYIQPFVFAVWHWLA